MKHPDYRAAGKLIKRKVSSVAGNPETIKTPVTEIVKMAAIEANKSVFRRLEGKNSSRRRKKLCYTPSRSRLTV